MGRRKTPSGIRQPTITGKSPMAVNAPCVCAVGSPFEGDGLCSTAVGGDQCHEVPTPSGHRSCKPRLPSFQTQSGRSAPIGASSHQLRSVEERTPAPVFGDRAFALISHDPNSHVFISCHVAPVIEDRLRHGTGDGLWRYSACVAAIAVRLSGAHRYAASTPSEIHSTIVP